MLEKLNKSEISEQIEGASQYDVSELTERDPDDVAENEESGSSDDLVNNKVASTYNPSKYLTQSASPQNTLGAKQKQPVTYSFKKRYMTTQAPQTKQSEGEWI